MLLCIGYARNNQNNELNKHDCGVEPNLVIVTRTHEATKFFHLLKFSLLTIIFTTNNIRNLFIVLSLLFI